MIGNLNCYGFNCWYDELVKEYEKLSSSFVTNKTKVGQGLKK